MTHSRLVLLILGIGLLTPAPLSAHALRAECSLKDGKVQVEAFFDDDLPAMNAKVEVLDGQERAMAAGKTDARGLWSFPAPAAGQYLVIVDAGMGHRARVPITVPDANSPATVAGRSSDAGEIISSGASRKDATSFPYLLYKVGLGVGSIFLFSLAFLMARKKSRGQQSLPE